MQEHGQMKKKTFVIFRKYIVYILKYIHTGHVGFDKTPNIKFIQHQRSSNYTNTFAYYRDIACIMVFRNKLILSKITNFSRQHHLITFLLYANENFIYKKMAKYVQKIQMPPIPATENRGITPQQKKWKNQKSNLACLLWSLTLCKRFQMIF